MRILVLDDDAVRQEAFRRNNPDHRVTGTESATEAIKQMKHEFHEVVFLDHDLDDHLSPGAPSNGTGLHVVRWIAHCEPNRRPLLTVVHSVNALGAGDMMRELTEAGCPCLYLPEAWTRQGIIGQLQTMLPAVAR